MNRKYLMSLIGAGALGLASLANATVIDFASLANTSPGESAGQPLVLGTYLGFTLDAYGYYNGNDAYAYLDAKSNGNDAGMGVCHLANGACGGKTDDNLGQNEVLKLDFGNQAWKFESLSFRNANHGTTFDQGAGFAISTDGGVSWSQHSLSENVDLSSPIMGNTFLIKEDPNTATPGNLGPSFYVNAITATAVPEPGVLALMGLGLVGIGLGSRKRKARAN